MADTDPTPNPAPEPAPAPAPTPAPAPAEQHVPYARFKEVNDKYTALKQQTEQQASSQTTLEQRLATLEKERADTAAENLRLKVASKKQLPDDLADRLRGSTAEELEADADRLLAFLKPKDGPGVPPPGSGARKAVIDLSKMTPAEIRKAHAEGKIV